MSKVSKNVEILILSMEKNLLKPFKEHFLCTTEKLNVRLPCFPLQKHPCLHHPLKQSRLVFLKSF